MHCFTCRNIPGWKIDFSLPSLNLPPHQRVDFPPHFRNALETCLRVHVGNVDTELFGSGNEHPVDKDLKIHED